MAPVGGALGRTIYTAGRKRRGVRRASVERWERRDVGTQRMKRNDAALVVLSVAELEQEDGAEGISRRGRSICNHGRVNSSVLLR